MSVTVINQTGASFHLLMVCFFLFLCHTNIGQNYFDICFETFWLFMPGVFVKRFQQKKGVVVFLKNFWHSAYFWCTECRFTKRRKALHGIWELVKNVNRYFRIKVKVYSDGTLTHLNYTPTIKGKIKIWGWYEAHWSTGIINLHRDTQIKNTL